MSTTMKSLDITPGMVLAIGTQQDLYQGNLSVGMLLVKGYNCMFPDGIFRKNSYQVLMLLPKESGCFTFPDHIVELVKKSLPQDVVVALQDTQREIQKAGYYITSYSYNMVQMSWSTWIEKRPHLKGMDKSMLRGAFEKFKATKLHDVQNIEVPDDPHFMLTELQGAVGKCMNHKIFDPVYDALVDRMFKVTWSIYNMRGKNFDE